MTAQLPLVDVVRELTETSPHVELYDHDGIGTSIHPSRTLSLIGQLRVAMVHSATSDVGGRPGYMSKPSARMDAVDALIRIDQGAVRWLHRLLGKGPTRSLPRSIVNLPTEALVFQLFGAGGSNDAVEKDLRGWWLHARLVTGWETPPMRPNGSCPTCRRRGGLRVRMERDASDRFVKFAMCVECKAEWTGDDESFDKLAWHIRVENGDLEPSDTRVRTGS